jgi:hypothetical protein
MAEARPPSLLPSSARLFVPSGNRRCGLTAWMPEQASGMTAFTEVFAGLHESPAEPSATAPQTHGMIGRRYFPQAAGAVTHRLFPLMRFD